MTSTQAPLKAAIRRLKKRLRALYKELGTWQKVGEAAGISGGAAFRIVKRKYIPKRKDIRLILDLPVEEPAPVCPVHGIVHVGRCPRPHQARQPWLSESEVEERLEFIDEIFNNGRR